jgi:hypothetical protein
MMMGRRVVVLVGWAAVGVVGFGVLAAGSKRGSLTTGRANLQGGDYPSVEELEDGFEDTSSDLTKARYAAMLVIALDEQSDQDYLDYLVDIAVSETWSDAPQVLGTDGELSSAFKEWAEGRGEDVEVAAGREAIDFGIELAALADTGDARASEVFSAALSSNNPEQRVSGATGLGLIGDTDAVEWIESAAAATEDQWAKWRIASALFLFEDGAAAAIATSIITDTAMADSLAMDASLNLQGFREITAFYWP